MITKLRRQNATESKLKRLIVSNKLNVNAQTFSPNKLQYDSLHQHLTLVQTNYNTTALGPYSLTLVVVVIARAHMRSRRSDRS